MSENFVHLHQHDHNSNQNYLEVVSKVDDYIEIAKERSLPAVAISNHGNVIDWYNRYQKIQLDNNLKYIHSIEAFVTDNCEEKVRDNFHLLLIAKNEKGWREINKLSSRSFNREDNHYYYAPRMYAEEIFNTSENLIVTSACLGSPLWQNYKEGNMVRFNEWVNFFVKNKDRAYFEVQPHLDSEQKEYNQILLDLAEKHGVPIVATNDVHASTKEHEVLRKKLKESKGVSYETDDDYELWAKTREEMVEAFSEQGVLTQEQINTALDNTMVIVNQIERFDVDKSIKYPSMFSKDKQQIADIDVTFLRDKPFEDSIDVFRQLVVNGYKERGVDKLPKEIQKNYIQRINHEMKAYIETGSVDYMLLEWSVKYAGRNKLINPNKVIKSGFGRGSSSGSVISFLLNIVQVDAVREGLSFERFINKDRVSVADIDTDYEPADQQSVQMYLLENDYYDSASIMTKGTYKLKGAIKVMGKGMGYTPSELNAITKSIDDKTGIIPIDIYEEHKDLIEISKKIDGTIQSYGRHACGIVITSEPLDEVMGTMTLTGWDYPVTQLDMKSIDNQNFTKLDVLSIDTLELIHNISDMTGIGEVTPYSNHIDFQDESLYKAMANDNTGIFQFEGDRAKELSQQMFSDETLARVRENNPDFRYLDLVSILSAGMRPSGASYIQNVVEAKPRIWGIKPLDNFLKDTFGEIIYQETQTAFLQEMCGWSPSHSDLIRRGIGKKSHEIMDEEVPKIKPSFVKNMVEKYGEDKEKVEDVADSFVKVFIDSSDYSFSLNHSLPYSTYAVINTYLRETYPLEFTASALEIWQKTDKEIKVLEYAEKQGISINPPKFRKSKGGYYVDKGNNAIYQGTGHIKGNNANVGNTLYQLKDRHYPTFTDLVIDVIENSNITIDDKEMSIQEFYRAYSEEDMKRMDKDLKVNPNLFTYDKSPLEINKTKMYGLLKLNFFSEFGKPKKLVKIYDYVIQNYKPSNKMYAGKQAKYLQCIEYEKSLEDEDYSIIEQCENELALTGRITVHSENIPPKYAFVTDVDVRKTITNATVYSINKGVATQVKVGAKIYNQAKFEVGDLIELQDLQVKAKRVEQDGQWIASPTEKDLWVKQLKFIRKTNIKKKG